MRKEDKMTGKGNLKRYYVEQDRARNIWVIRDRQNGNETAFSFHSRDDARYYMRKLHADLPVGVEHVSQEAGTTG